MAVCSWSLMLFALAAAGSLLWSVFMLALRPVAANVRDKVNWLVTRLVPLLY